jgi:hypothetical protein
VNRGGGSHGDIRDRCPSNATAAVDSGFPDRGGRGARALFINAVHYPWSAVLMVLTLKLMHVVAAVIIVGLLTTLVRAR